MNADGSIDRELSFGELGLTQEEWQRLLNELSWGEGWAGQRLGNLLALYWGDNDQVVCYDLEKQEMVKLHHTEWNDLSQKLHPWEEPAKPAIPDAEPVQDLLLGSDAPMLLKVVEHDGGDASYSYYMENGDALPRFTQYGFQWYQRINLVGGLIEELDLNTAAYYDLETQECVFRTSLGYEGD